MKRTITLAILSVSYLTLPIHVIAQKIMAPLPVPAVARDRTFSPRVQVGLSPDGEWVAYTIYARRVEPPTKETWFYTTSGVTRADGNDGLEVWLSNTTTGKTKKLDQGQGSSWAPVWSPDGQRLAFFSDRSGLAQLWVWEKATGQTRRVSASIIRVFIGYEAVRWTADSRSVICKLLPEGMTLQSAAKLLPSFAEKKVIALPKDENTSTAIVVGSPATRSKVAGNSNSQSDWNAGDWENLYLADLALINVESGKTQRFARNVRAQWYSLSPDNNHVAFTSSSGAKKQRIVYSLDKRQSRVVTPNVVTADVLNASWSPDGNLLAYLSSDNSGQGECFVVSSDGGEPRKLGKVPNPGATDEYKRSVTYEHRVPLWDASGQTLYFVGAGALWKIVVSTGAASEVAKIPSRIITKIITPARGERFWSPDNGQSIVVTTLDDETKNVGFYKINLTTGQPANLIEENKHYAGPFGVDVSADGRNIVYVAENAQIAPELWTSDANFRSVRQVTNLMGELDRYVMGESELVEWRGVNGEKLRGALLLPAGYKKGTSYPLVVWVYGGDFGSDYVNRFGLLSLIAERNMQVLATRGYAVLFPDAPLRIGNTMKDTANTVLPGIDRLVELGIADPDRLAVMGQSYGSYSTLALIVQTTRFKAAVISAVVAPDIVTHYLHMDENAIGGGFSYYEISPRGMGGTLWQYKDRYIENSPIFYFDKVQTPLLMVQGTEDALPMYFPGQVYLALRRLGKEVEFVQYGGEGHGIEGYANVVDYWNRRIAFLEKHLKPSKK